MDVPLVSDYKLGFAWRRILQTLFGGARFVLGYPVPLSLRVSQLLLFSMPAVVGSLFTVLVEAGSMTTVAAMALDGVLVNVFATVLQVLRTLSENPRRTAIVHFQASTDSEFETRSTKPHRVVKVESPTSSFVDDSDVQPSPESLKCCSAEALRFLVPFRRAPAAVLLHAATAAVLHALALEFLLPSVQAEAWGSFTTGSLLCGFGWVSLCCSLYSSTGSCPPEPAVYEPIVGAYLGPLHRPIYLALILIAHLICRHTRRWESVWAQEVDAYLRLLWISLPLLWLASLLPPPQSLLHWAAEQANRWLLGGAPSYSLPRQISCLVLGVGEVIGICYVSNWTAMFQIALFVGFILSQDLDSLFGWCQKQILDHGFRNEVKAVSGPKTDSPTSAPTFGRCPAPFRVAVALTSVTLTSVLAHLTTCLENKDSSRLRPWLGVVAMVLYLSLWTLQQLQGVYLCGLVRNPLYPTPATNLESFKRRKYSLRYLRYLRVFLYQLGIPVLVVCYVVSWGQSSNSAWVLNRLALVRAFRNVWQHTDLSLLEVAVSEVALRCGLPLGGCMDLPVLLLVTGFLLDRLQLTLNGLYLVVVLTVATLTQPKQRLRFGWLLAAGNVLASPLLLSLVMLSSLLSAPLLPILTLPFFLVGFPRPVKFWPGKVLPWQSGGEDSIYYEQAIPQFLAGMETGLAAGSFGFVQSGDYLLARFQDRLLWIQVLERGHMYCKLSAKGLELQETSCHAVEATQVDAIYESAFQKEEKTSRWLNLNVASVLSPSDIVLAKVYSDARSALTGVMDSPDLVEHLHNYFPKVLLWVILARGLRQVLDHQARTDLQKSAFLRKSPSVGSTIKSILHDISREVSGKGASSDKWAEPVSNRSMSSLWSTDEEDDVLGDLPSGRVRMESEPVRVGSGRIRSGRTGSATLTPGSTMSDEEEIIPEKEEKVEEVKPNRPPSGDGFKSVQLSDISELPILNLPQETKRTSGSLEPPSSWKLAYETNRGRCGSGRSFSQDWLSRVMKFQAASSFEVKAVLEDTEETVWKDYSDIVRLCCYAVQCTKQAARPKGSCAYTLHLIYSGCLPQSLVMGDVFNCKDLKVLLTKAYRYSLKLALDEILLQGVVDESDLLRQLHEYDERWYIGDESDKDWATAVAKETEFLFAVTYNPVQCVYRSHLLTLQESPIFVGHLNRASVNGIWSSLALELLYLTNDDDERYSIQAHPTLLRNLTIQAADPPLGYPVYSSGAVTLQTLL